MTLGDVVEALSACVIALAMMCIFILVGGLLAGVAAALLTLGLFGLYIAQGLTQPIRRTSE